MRIEMGDSDFPMAAGSGGSFGANSSGGALYDACGVRARDYPLTLDKVLAGLANA